MSDKETIKALQEMLRGRDALIAQIGLATGSAGGISEELPERIRKLLAAKAQRIKMLELLAAKQHGGIRVRDALLTKISRAVGAPPNSHFVDLPKQIDAKNQQISKLKAKIKKLKEGPAHEHR